MSFRPLRSAAQRHHALPLLLALGGLSSLPAQAAVPLGTHSTLDFTGYLRTGIGLSRGGEQQEMFSAPGTASKYRLGNEADTNIELAADYRYYLDGSGAVEGPYVQGVFMLKGYRVHGEGTRMDLDHVSQAYMKFANFFDNDISLWVGRRYYERQSTYMTDYYWLNTAQNTEGGAGVEGIHLLGGEFKLAALRSEERRADETILSSHLDARLVNLPVNDGGHLNLFAMYALRHEQEDLNLDKEDGFAVAAWHTQELFGQRARHTVRLMHRDGAAVAQGNAAPNPLINDADITSARMSEVGSDLVYEPNGDFALGFTAVYRKDTQRRLGEKVDHDWYSVGVRPQFFISDHVSWVFDLGYDHVDTGQVDGGLLKGTAALQLGRARGYWARPVLRAFVTGAVWDSELKGQVGGDTYASSTRGWTAGIQGEWSW